MTVTYEFPASASGAPPVKLVWHQGDSKPPGWVPEWGGRSQLFIGDAGMLLGNGTLLPQEKFTDFQQPPETLPRSPATGFEWSTTPKGSARSRLELPVLRLDDRTRITSATSRIGPGKRLSGIPESARSQRAGSRALHQEARVPQRLGRHPEIVAASPYGDHPAGSREARARRVGVSAIRPDAGRGIGADEADDRLAASASRNDRLEPRAAGDITRIALAREIGLDGIQVSLQFPTDGKTPTLRDPGTQAAFRRAALDNGIQICSLAIGSPADRGSRCTPTGGGDPAHRGRGSRPQPRHRQHLLPILGDSHIDMTNQTQVDTFIAMMKEVARYAEKHGVVVRAGRLDLGRGQHQAAGCHRFGLRGRLL